MKRGFTLIELVFIIAILGILAALYTSSTGDLSDVAIDVASRKIQSDLRYAQSLAVSTGVNHGAVFTAGNGYQVYQISPGNYAKDPVTKEDMVIELDDFQGVALSTSTQIEFDKTGIPVMGADERIRLTASSGAIRDVYVVDKTGAVVIDLIEYGTGCSCNLCMGGM